MSKDYVDVLLDDYLGESTAEELGTLPDEPTLPGEDDLLEIIPHADFILDDERLLGEDDELDNE